MKPRSRELSIFSMSALDLFASGMGAFILLAIMALAVLPQYRQRSGTRAGART